MLTSSNHLVEFGLTSSGVRAPLHNQMQSNWNRFSCGYELISSFDATNEIISITIELNCLRGLSSETGGLWSSSGNWIRPNCISLKRLSRFIWGSHHQCKWRSSRTRKSKCVARIFGFIIHFDWWTRQTTNLVSFDDLRWLTRPKWRAELVQTQAN